MTDTLYQMRLTCGCERWYPVSIHPFHGALLHCSEHGFVRSQGQPLALKDELIDAGS